MDSMPDRPARRLADGKGRCIAVVVPLHGPAGLFGPSCEAAARLAAAEVNAAGGLLGEPVELLFVDGGAPPEQVAGALRAEVAAGRVHAVTGWHISSVRRALVPVLGGSVPYVYPSLYEGGERHAGVICTGEVPDAQVRPALRWLRDELGVRRWFIAGNDYVWPRKTAQSTVQAARHERLEVVGARFVPLPAAAGQLDRVLESVERSGCQGVLMLFAGQDGVEFNRRFARRKMDRALVRFSPLMEENMLMASGPTATEGLFVAAGYFRSMVAGGALEFQGRYSAAYGPDAPVLNAVAESTYTGVHVLVDLANRAGGLSVPRMSALLEDEKTVLEVPRGRLRLTRAGAVQDVHLALARGCDFDIVSTL